MLLQKQRGHRGLARIVSSSQDQSLFQRQQTETSLSPSALSIDDLSLKKVAANQGLLADDTVETWLDNIISTLISWGGDMRIDEESYEFLDGTALQKELFGALSNLHEQVDTIMESLRDK